MIEQFNFAKDFHNVTTVHPVGVVALVMAIVAIMLVPRRHVLIPILVIACVIAPAQRLVIVGFDFTFLRLVLSAAWVRVLIRDEHRELTPVLLDRVIVAWALFSAAAYLILFPNAASISYQLGVVFDAMTTYFLVRILVRDVPALTSLARAAAVISIPVAVAMTYERITGHNVFSIFGGVAERTTERFGRFRAQAAFSHSIIAGTFWAILIPMIMAGIRRDAGSIALTIVGVASSLVIVWCCSSSTPVLLAAMLVPASGLFLARWALPWLRVGAVAMLLLLHLVMFAPVWHLFARINFFPGSTGWWRYLILDRFINRWEDWVLIGTTRSHGWLSDNSFVDVTNQYVTEGINGGIVKLGLFLAMLVIGFMSVGQAIRARENAPIARPGNTFGVHRTWMAWCVGVMICLHAAAYFATAYFGQLVMLQYLTFGLAASMPVVVGHASLRLRPRGVGEAETVAGRAQGRASAGTDDAATATPPAPRPAPPPMHPAITRAVDVARPALFRPI